MKRGVYILVLLFSLGFVLATPSINFQNEEIQVGETILGTISTVGEFTNSISQGDISFFEGRRPTTFEFEIFPYNGTYFFYIYANREGNFSMKIEDVLFKEEDQLSSADLEKVFVIENKPEIIEEEINESGNITIQNKTITRILQLKPGAVFTANFPTIKLINKGNFEMDLTYGEEEITLAPSETREVLISPPESFSYLNISSYKNFAVPIIYLSVLNESVWTGEEELLKVDKSLIHINLVAGEEKRENITFFNFAEENITDIEISSDIEFLKIEEIEEIPAKEDKTITFTIEAEGEGFVGGEILVEYEVEGEGRNITLPVNIYILAEGSSIENFSLGEETCSEKEGIFCSTNEYCEGATNWTSDSPHYCCLGNCQENEDPRGDDEGGYGWLIGLLILVVLGVIGFFVYKKYKKAKPQKPKDKLEDIGKKYETRVKGGVTRA
jgi:hypothetical protein